MKTRYAQRLTALALTLAAATGTLAVSASPASAATRDCSSEWAHPNKSDATATVIASGVNYRTGPDHNTCTVKGSWGLSTSLYLWCWDYGSYVSTSQVGSNIWWYGRRSGTQEQGWIASVYLKVNSGSQYRCR
ncbi:hypothetical protein [Kitasatospora sp. NPDC004289]